MEGIMKFRLVFKDCFAHVAFLFCFLIFTLYIIVVELPSLCTRCVVTPDVIPIYWSSISLDYGVWSCTLPNTCPKEKVVK